MDKIKRKIRLYKLCGINIFTLIFCLAVAVFMSKVLGMSLVILNEQFFHLWFLYGEDTLMYFLLFWLLFDFYRKNIRNLQFPPYPREEMLGAWLNILKILIGVRVIFQTIGIKEEMQFFLMCYETGSDRLILLCIGYAVIIMLGAVLDMSFLSLAIYSMMKSAEKYRSDKKFYIYVFVISVLCIVWGLIGSAAVRFIPLTLASVIVYAVLFIIGLIASDIVVSNILKRSNTI